MGTDKPQISILMAVYEPRMDWLREQLLSLEAQSYPNIKLYIRDDCSPTVPFEEISKCVRECICSFPYELKKNEQNLGSNRTFEQLTAEADGEYFAYCDQDDIWLPEKIELLFEELMESKAGLIYSDTILIDENGKQFADSITKLRPRHIFRSGSGLADGLLYRNFVIGCTSLVKSSLAKAALPFAKSMVHDHYLAVFCAINGQIAVASQPLIRYRIHGGNQTNVLAKIDDKASYRERHILPFCGRIAELSARFSFAGLTCASQWAQARLENYAALPFGFRAVVKLWRLRAVNKTTTLFEIAVLRLPKPFFKMILKKIQAGKI